MLKDPSGRTIDYIRISVIDRCNLRCIYCMPDGKHTCSRPPDVLKLEEIVSFVRVAMGHGLKKVRLTGGEPLLRPDILDIVQGLKALGLPELGITTNGLLLARMAPALKKAGLDRVNVSLDSMDPERFSRITGGGPLEAVVEGIREAGKAGLAPVKINMVPIRGVNDADTVPLARLALENPWHIRFIELMPLREGRWKETDTVKTPEIMRRITDSGINLLPAGEFGSSRNYTPDGGRGVIGFISSVTNHFCSSCNRMRLTSTGKIRPCLFSETEFDIRQAVGPRELERIFLEAVRSKPEGKGRKASLPLKDMSQVGG